MQSHLSRRTALTCVVALSLLTGACAHRPATDAAKATPIVVAANPLASKAGMDILKSGGTAIDAAVAVQATLGLVEPQSSGLGGGAFMTYYDAATGRVIAYDGREVAPASAKGDLFLRDGQPLSYAEAVTSGRATGVPGAVLMLAAAHKDHGKLPWHDLFGSSITLAETGFTISPRLGNYLKSERFPQSKTEDYRTYWGNGQGGLKTTGDIQTNPAYAETLKTLAEDGAAIFQSGPLVDQIIARTHQGPLPGDLQPSDFANYRPLEQAPVCGPYRVYIVCAPPPPSSGVSLIQGLQLLERFPMAAWGKDDARGWSALIEAEKLMYADRDQYVADPAFVRVPTEGLIDPAYVAERAAMITPGTPSPAPKAGTPPLKDEDVIVVMAPDNTHEPAGTSHFVIMDAYGNAVSMTTTVESVFGTGRMVGGFFLNNQLTDFSFSPVMADGQKAANAVEGGKRPRSSMSPVIVLDKDRKVVALIGSPGGSNILGYNLKTLVATLDWGMTVQDAAALPNVIARGDSLRIETGRMNPEVVTALTNMGYTITPSAGEESGIHGIMRAPDGTFDGGADPRREGVVLKGQP
ncbi:gamma-glutamyltransferase [Asticcacaulis machinosus]|uniref:Glutathione hydrolase proenzyme n=1 Tax=Asticcacaulis machinosus TaxID=2984211 RepID=A0ABT5HJW4_9CAUL|nr:gamma-glutamyltransferase [Asticcacaulis machinosus]MDC7676298.1 gamma-glutamyltransferase [Asticcacaulis machinosus]